MHKVIADKNGGKQVALTAPEIVAVKADWEKNRLAQVQVDKEEAAKILKRDAAFAKLKSVAGLSDEEISLIKNI